MALIHIYGATLIGLVLLFGVNFVDSTSCNKCSSAKDGENCEIEVKNVSQCTPDGNYDRCMTYQHPSNDGSIVTVRDCPFEAYFNCKALYDADEHLVMCNECNNTEGFCNGNIDTSNTCVKCDSSAGQDCGDIIKDVGGNTCFLDNTVNTECFVYKYKGGNDSSTITTVRGCGRKNTCQTLRSGDYKDTLLMCDECSNSNGTNCNQNISVPETCVKCNSLEQPGCENGTIDTSIITGTCNLDETVNTECITYKYNNGSTIVTVRDCASKDTCEDFLSDTYKDTLVMCHECSDSPNCNQNLNGLPTCVECNSLHDANCSESKIDTTSTTGVCYLDSIVNFECITYKYQENSITVSVRGCAPDKNCEVLLTDTYKDALLMCDECSDGNDTNNCNQEFDTTKTCIQCSSENNADCENVATNITNVCYLDQTVKNKCVGYKYQKDNSTEVTIRDCAQKDYCETLKTDSSIMCYECTGNNCNSEIPNHQCVQCNSIDDPKCADDIVDTKVVDGTCDLDGVVNVECISYKYWQDGQSHTYRGCGSKKFCEQAWSNWSNTTTCISCTDDDSNYNKMCNSNVTFDPEKTLCIQCTSEDDEECGKDDMNSSKINNYCHLDDGNSDCVAYKYFNLKTGKISTYRGCKLENYCDDLLLTDDPTRVLMMCTECSIDVCNTRIDTSAEQIMCVDCTGEEGSDCANITIDYLTYEVPYPICPLTDNNQQCITYKYLDEQTKTIQIKRGCEYTDYCYTYKNDSNTLICDECHDEICNNENGNGGKIICVQCSGEEDSQCGTNTVDLSEVNFCIADSTCIYHKYLNVSTGKFNIHRGCGAEDYCTQQSKVNNGSTTALCKQCNDTDHCNMNIDPSEESTLCVFCEGEEGSDCAAASVNLTKTSFCGISPENATDTECMSYRYVKESTNTLTTVRGCLNTKCSTLVVDDGKIQQCSECHKDICNDYLEIITTTTLPPTKTTLPPTNPTMLPTTTLPPTTTSGATSIIQYKFIVLYLYLIISVLF